MAHERDRGRREEPRRLVATMGQGPRVGGPGERGWEADGREGEAMSEAWPFPRWSQNFWN